MLQIDLTYLEDQLPKNKRGVIDRIRSMEDLVNTIIRSVQRIWVNSSNRITGDSTVVKRCRPEAFPNGSTGLCEILHCKKTRQIDLKIQSCRSKNTHFTPFTLNLVLRDNFKRQGFPRIEPVEHPGMIRANPDQQEGGIPYEIGNNAFGRIAGNEGENGPRVERPL